MKITADFKRLHSGENESRTLTVEKGDEYAALSGKLAFITPMGRIYISDELSFSEGRAEYPIPAMLLDGKGELIVQLVLYDDNRFTLKSPIQRYPVFASVDMMDLPECTDAKLMSLIDIIDELMNKSDVGHIHGDIYFTKDEIHSLLKGKSDTSHLHEGVYLTEAQLRQLLPEIPGTIFEHNHDGRYYTREFVDKALSDINAQQASVQDTVVEQGTDGIWSYRKWASGVAECWAHHSLNIAESTGVGGEVRAIVDYPFSFTKVPIVFIHALTKAYQIKKSYQLTPTTIDNRSKLMIFSKIEADQVIGENEAVSWYINVKGYWK